MTGARPIHGMTSTSQEARCRAGEGETMTARRKAASPGKKKVVPRRKPGPEDADVPPGQHPVRQTKNPKQPPREEKAEAERPHPGRHHPPRDGL